MKGADLKKGDKFIVRIKRQDTPTSRPYWEAFEIEYRPGMNVITILQDIQRNPVTIDGKETSPVSWDSNCLEGVCGACSMLINHKPAQACLTLVKDLTLPITLEPLSTFPVIRDLIVDRQRLFKNLIDIKGWIPIDGTHDLGAGPRYYPEQRDFAYMLSRCMTCGLCLEACPQVNERSQFMGPAIMAQIVYFNLHPTGKSLEMERLKIAAGVGGVTECGNAQNCIEVCPKDVPLVEAIAMLARQTTKKIFFGALNK